MIGYSHKLYISNCWLIINPFPPEKLLMAFSYIESKNIETIKTMKEGNDEYIKDLMEIPLFNNT